MLDELNPSPNAAAHQRFGWVVPAAAVVVGGFYCLALLKRWVNPVFPLRANTALGFLCLACALWLARGAQQNLTSRRVVLTLCGVASAIAAATLREYFFGTNWGIDQFFLADPEGFWAGFPPGRPAPATCLSLIFLSIAFAMSATRRTTLHGAAQLLGVVSLCVAVQSLLASLAGFQASGAAFYTQMAVQTSVSFVVLSVAVFFIHPQVGLVRSLFDSNDAHQTEAKFKTIAEGIPQLVWTARADGAIEYANQRWFDYTGMNREQTLNWGWQNCLHPEDLETNLALWQQGRDKGEDVTAEFRLRRHDGVYRWHMVRGRPLKDARGKVTRWLGTITDIEEQKEAHEAIQKALTARNELLSICSHELRTPVAAMKLHTQMALRNIAKSIPGALDADTVKQWLGQSNKQLDRLTRLIEEMLDFSRVIGGRLKLNPESFDLVQLIDEVAARFAPRIEEAKSTLNYLLAHPLNLNADRFRVEQVLTNVIGNAIQYAPGKPIHLTVQPGDKQVTLVIEDEGPGIPPADIARIFEPYERAISPMHISGLGLGLYISRQIILAHGGKIQAENSPTHGGARFSIALPLAS